MTPYTKARFLSEVGKKTEVFVRFSTVAGGARRAPTRCATRAASRVKFYTEDGNYDLVGNDTPIFFIRDPLKFPDFIHSQKPDPRTNRQEPDNVWDFFSLSPEATHMFTWLFGDRGIPASYRHMDGFGSHTFQWTNAAGEQSFVKYHFKTDQGIAVPDGRGGGEGRRREPRLAPDRPAAGHRPRRAPDVDAQGADHAGGGGDRPTASTRSTSPRSGPTPTTRCAPSAS